jgi:hypothetical protein
MSHQQAGPATPQPTPVAFGERLWQAQTPPETALELPTPVQGRCPRPSSGGGCLTYDRWSGLDVVCKVAKVRRLESEISLSTGHLTRCVI